MKTADQISKLFTVKTKSDVGNSAHNNMIIVGKYPHNGSTGNKHGKVISRRNIGDSPDDTHDCTHFPDKTIRHGVWQV